MFKINQVSLNSYIYILANFWALLHPYVPPKLKDCFVCSIRVHLLVSQKNQLIALIDFDCFIRVCV